MNGDIVDINSYRDARNARLYSGELHQGFKRFLHDFSYGTTHTHDAAEPADRPRSTVCELDVVPRSEIFEYLNGMREDGTFDDFLVGHAFDAEGKQDPHVFKVFGIIRD